MHPDRRDLAGGEPEPFGLRLVVLDDGVKSPVRSPRHSS